MIREVLGNAKMAYINMNLDIDSKKVVQDIFDLLDEDKESIEKANRIDVKNNNGFKIDFEIINQIKDSVSDIEDMYRKVIELYKNQNNYLQGKQTDNLGTLCLVFDGNTYCMLELILKSILTHNAIIITSESDYMKGTNELILILVRRILEAYNIDKNLVQILYTSKLEELLSNGVSINKVIAIGSQSFQGKIKKISKVEVVCYGYNNFDLYIEDITHVEFIKEIIKANANIDIYVKEGIVVPFEDYIEVADIEEAIAQINFNTSGYSSSIFTSSSENATQFLREIKTKNISVNSSPLFNKGVDIDVEILLNKKTMFYPNPLQEGTGGTRFEFPTQKAILEKIKQDKDREIIEKEVQE